MSGAGGASEVGAVSGVGSVGGVIPAGQAKRKAGSGSRRWPLIVVAICGSIVGFGLLVFLLLPSLTSVAAVEVVEDPQSFKISTSAEVEPAKGWSVQPMPRGEGLLLHSPDRMLTVELREALPDDQLEGRVLVETLKDGSRLSHSTEGGRIEALLSLDDVGAGAVVLVVASVDDEADLSGYRAELAELLLRIQPVG